MPEPSLGYLRAIRRGEIPLQEVVQAVDGAEHQLLSSQSRSALPEGTDRDWVDGWLHRSYLPFWATP